MLLVDIPTLYKARVDLDVQPKPIWGLPVVGTIPHDDSEADIRFSLFEYEKYAEQYGIKVRFLIVLIKTDIILKIVNTLTSFGDDMKNLLLNVIRGGDE